MCLLSKNKKYFFLGKKIFQFYVLHAISYEKSKEKNNGKINTHTATGDRNCKT